MEPPRVNSPPPRDEGVRSRLRQQRVRDTAPELALRRALHAMGFRYRVHAQPLPGLRRKADLVFPRVRVAVFVDGCFWHGCPDHGTQPQHNPLWWQEKLERNVARDQDTTRRLREAGWDVVRVWEHEDPLEAALRVATAVAAGRSKPA